MVYSTKDQPLLNRCTWYCWGHTGVWGDPVGRQTVEGRSSTEQTEMLIVLQEDRRTKTITITVWAQREQPGRVKDDCGQRERMLCVHPAGVWGSGSKKNELVLLFLWVPFSE